MKHVKKFNTEEQYLTYKQNNPDITYTAGIINDGNSETIVADQKYVEFEDPEVYRILTTVIPGQGITVGLDGQAVIPGRDCVLYATASKIPLKH